MFLRFHAVLGSQQVNGSADGELIDGDGQIDDTDLNQLKHGPV